STCHEQATRFGLGGGIKQMIESKLARPSNASVDQTRCTRPLAFERDTTTIAMCDAGRIGFFLSYRLKREASDASTGWLPVLETVILALDGPIPMDHVPPDRRSFIMRMVKTSDTKPEVAVRRLLHGLGFRFRLRNKHLPGTPDVVLPKWRTVVLIHGCFW